MCKKNQRMTQHSAKYSKWNHKNNSLESSGIISNTKMGKWIKIFDQQGTNSHYKFQNGHFIFKLH